MTASERVIPYLSVAQVAQMANCGNGVVVKAVDRGEIKALNSPTDGTKKFWRRLDPHSATVWIEKRQIHELELLEAKKAKLEKKASKKQPKLPLESGETQLDRIERKLDLLIKHFIG